MNSADTKPIAISMLIIDILRAWHGIAVNYSS
jgi:hypothetical protein